MTKLSKQFSNIYKDMNHDTMFYSYNVMLFLSSFSWFPIACNDGLYKIIMGMTSDRALSFHNTYSGPISRHWILLTIVLGQIVKTNNCLICLTSIVRCKIVRSPLSITPWFWYRLSYYINPMILQWANITLTPRIPGYWEPMFVWLRALWYKLGQ